MAGCPHLAVPVPLQQVPLTQPAVVVEEDVALVLVHVHRVRPHLASNTAIQIRWGRSRGRRRARPS
eukprot:7836528-Pyramimonas_sp.AAC.1